MKKICLFVFLFSYVFVFADENCDEALKEGKQKYKAGDYSAACELFRWVSAECGSSYKDVESWLSKSCEVKLTVSNTSISVPSLATTRSITVTCSRAWTFQKNSGNWYSLTKNGNTLNVAITANTDSNTRTGSFVVKTTDDAKSIVISISQSGSATPTPTPTPSSGSSTVGSYSSSPIGTIIQQTLQNDDTRNIHLVLYDNRTFGISGKVISYTDVATPLKECSNKIGELQELKTGTINEIGQGIIIYGKNGAWWEGNGPESGVCDKLIEINKSHDSINEVSISPNGKYYFIAHQGAMWSTRVPKEMNEKLKEYNDETVIAASINDNGEFVIITNKHLYGSTTYLHNALIETKNRYGHIENVCITNNGIVVVAENGIYLHNVPTRVYEKLIKITGYKPKVVKFTDSGTYLITDGVSKYSTLM